MKVTKVYKVGGVSCLSELADCRLPGRQEPQDRSEPWHVLSRHRDTAGQAGSAAVVSSRLKERGP